MIYHLIMLGIGIIAIGVVIGLVISIARWILNLTKRR